MLKLTNLPRDLAADCPECGHTMPLPSVAANAGLCGLCGAVVIDYVNCLLDEEREAGLDNEETEMTADGLDANGTERTTGTVPESEMRQPIGCDSRERAAL